MSKFDTKKSARTDYRGTLFRPRGSTIQKTPTEVTYLKRKKKLTKEKNCCDKEQHHEANTNLLIEVAYGKVPLRAG